MRATRFPSPAMRKLTTTDILLFLFTAALWAAVILLSVRAW